VVQYLAPPPASHATVGGCHRRAVSPEVSRSLEVPVEELERPPPRQIGRRRMIVRYGEFSFPDQRPTGRGTPGREDLAAVHGIPVDKTAQIPGDPQGPSRRPLKIAPSPAERSPVPQGPAWHP
jgi:hypothetical protein